MRRRTALFTALPALVLLAPVGAATSASAGVVGIGCPVTQDGKMLVQAPQDTTSLIIDADSDSVDASWNGNPLCSNDVAVVTSVEVSRDPSSGPITWQVDFDSPVPGPVVFLNDAVDGLWVRASDRNDRASTTGPTRIKVARGGASNVVRLATAPASTLLDLGAGTDTVDTTTDTRWVSGVVVSGNGGDKEVTTGVGDDSVYLFDVDDRSRFADTVSTGSGDDFAATYGGADTVRLGAGDDEVELGAGRDRALGGAGADRFMAKDGQRDVLEGGTGRDGAQRDAVDVRRSIEYRLR